MQLFSYLGMQHAISALIHRRSSTDADKPARRVLEVSQGHQTEPGHQTVFGEFQAKNLGRSHYGLKNLVLFKSLWDC